MSAPPRNGIEIYPIADRFLIIQYRDGVYWRSSFADSLIDARLAAERAKDEYPHRIAARLKVRELQVESET